MILYKYYGRSGGEKAIQTQQLGFRNPIHFNDPFELSGLSNFSGYHDIKALISFIEDVGVLCLTKSPLNPLMWAHYSDQHKGFVVGYDVSGDFLNDKEFNVIPAREGNVFYTSRKESRELRQEDKDSIALEVWHCVVEPSEDKNFSFAVLRNAILQKHISWAYEEEVRVVKRLFSFGKTVDEFSQHPYGKFNVISEPIPGRPGHRRTVEGCEGLYISPVKTPIKEVYFGLRCEVDDLSEPTKSALACVPNLYKVGMAQDSWELAATPISILPHKS